MNIFQIYILYLVGDLLSSLLIAHLIIYQLRGVLCEHERVHSIDGGPLALRGARAAHGVVFRCSNFQKAIYVPVHSSVIIIIKPWCGWGKLIN